MAQKQQKNQDDPTWNCARDLLIVELVSGVSRHIRKIVRCDLNRGHSDRAVFEETTAQVPSRR